jgi:hypothetical protein
MTHPLISKGQACFVQGQHYQKHLPLLTHQQQSVRAEQSACCFRVSQVGGGQVPEALHVDPSLHSWSVKQSNVGKCRQKVSNCMHVRPYRAC